MSAYGVQLRLDDGELAHLPRRELADHRYDEPDELISAGDEVYVKCIGFKNNGQAIFSRREALISG